MTAKQALNEIMEYTYGMLTSEKAGLQHKIQSMLDDLEQTQPQESRCVDCSHYGKLSLDCGRCDDDCSMFEPQDGDLISRQAVLDCLKATKLKKFDWILEARERIKELLSVSQPNEDTLYFEYMRGYDKGKASVSQPQYGDLISRQSLLDDLYKRAYTEFTHRDFVALVSYQDTVKQEFKQEFKQDLNNGDRAVSLNAALKCLEFKGDYATLNTLYEKMIRLPSIDLSKWAEEHGYVIIDEDVWKDAKKELSNHKFLNVDNPYKKGWNDAISALIENPSVSQNSDVVWRGNNYNTITVSQAESDDLQKAIKVLEQTQPQNVDTEIIKTILDTGEYNFIKEKLTKDEIWKIALLINLCMDGGDPE